MIFDYDIFGLVLGVDKISDAALESLSKHQGFLSLHSLKALSDAAAESLSKHQGEIKFEYPMEISFYAAELLGIDPYDL